MEQKVICRITVEDLRIAIKKGLYDTESLVENEFLVTSAVEYLHENLQAGQYLDYAQLASVIKSNMLKPNGLLEKVAMDIIQDVRNHWPFAKSVSVKIKKLNPHFKHPMTAVVVDMIWVS